MTLKATALLAISVIAGALIGCQTAEDAFVGDRLMNICDEAYWICNRPSQCVLADDEYTEGGFPGVRRLVVPVETENTTIEIRLFFQTMEFPGTELSLQLFDPDCHIDPNDGEIHVLDTDIFEVAGDDRTLTYRLESSRPGEHLLELFSDAGAKYLLTIESK